MYVNTNAIVGATAPGRPTLKQQHKKTGDRGGRLYKVAIRIK